MSDNGESITEAGPAFRASEDEVAQDWNALADHLARHGLRLDRDVTPRQFAGGFGNLNYLISVDGEPAVLRRPPMGPIPVGANDMKREHTILSRLWSALPLAPRSIHYCPDEEVLGAHFLIMEYRPGLVIRGELPPGLQGNAQLAREIGERLVDTLVAIHSVDAHAIGLGDFGRPEGFVSRNIEGWARRAMDAGDGSPDTAVSALIDWLRREQVPDQAPVLLHNDFKLDNLVLDPDSLKPRGILDWDMGSRGDPLVDLATLLSYWTEKDDPQAMHDLAQMPTAGDGFPDRGEVVGHYARATGVDVSHIRFYRVLAMFKLAIVFRQLHQRYLTAGTTDSRYARFGALSEGILDFTHEIAMGRAF